MTRALPKTVTIPIEWPRRWPGKSRRFWFKVAVAKHRRGIKTKDYAKIEQIIRELEKTEEKDNV